MIKQISLTNFKCFRNKTSFDIKKVSIFTGYNGRGKSTVLQSLLLLSQSYIKKRPEELHLDGEWMSFCNYFDLINADNKEKSLIEFEILTDDKSASRINLGYDVSNDDMVGELTECMINNENYFDSVGNANASETESRSRKLTRSIPTNVSIMMESIHFISANRRGPIKYVEKREVPEFHRVGKNGDFTINTLASYNDTLKGEMNIDRDDNSKYSLKDLTSKWMSFIMDGGGEVNLLGNERDSSVLTMRISGANISNPFSLDNVGFGYSYILSIIVTALIAKPGSIVIIENPEAHLHPAAQSRITHILARLAERGVQVMLETHSEHILNGFRLNALKDECSLSNEDLSIYFFDKDYSCTSLEVQSNGRIPNWPSGFFDQQQHDLADIIRLGQGK